MPLFHLQLNTAIQIKPSSFSKEKDLQKIFEKNLEIMLSVRFVASEFSTGNQQKGRIDTLGIDQDGSPIIIEYKKTSNENIITQGLYYYHWLIDHKGDFTVAMQAKLGKDIIIDWSRPRLLLIAEKFSEYDKSAISHIYANIELMTFHLYGEDYIYLDPIFVSESERATKKQIGQAKETSLDIEYIVESHLKGKPENIKSLYKDLQEQIKLLDEDGAIIEKATKRYIAYKHGKNFCEIWVQIEQLKIWLDIPFSELDDPRKIGRDVSKVGHWGTGNVEINLNSLNELSYIMELITQAYNLTV
jgi:predicted transport protein